MSVTSCPPYPGCRNRVRYEGSWRRPLLRRPVRQNPGVGVAATDGVKAVAVGLPVSVRMRPGTGSHCPER